MFKNVHLLTGVVAAAALAAALSGCNKAATGQVAAVVNGEEISLQELNAEMATTKLPTGADKNIIRGQALQRIVDRRVMAQQATTAGIDRDPEYLLRRRQVDEALLLQLYAKKTQDTLRIPDATAVSRYIADHPQIFADRTIFDVEQIRFPTPTDRSVIDDLKDAHTMAQVAAALKAKGVQFSAGNSKIDSAEVPPQLLTQVIALPPGEPFIVPSPEGVVVSVITHAAKVSLPPEQSKPVAVQAIRNEQLGKLFDQRLKDAKANAKIEYQSGLGPPAPAHLNAPSSATPKI